MTLIKKHIYLQSNDKVNIAQSQYVPLRMRIVPVCLGFVFYLCYILIHGYLY